MHTISFSADTIRTDLISERTDFLKNVKKREEKGVKIEEYLLEDGHYTTIYFHDVTDQEHYHIVEEIFVDELKKYISLDKNDTILVIGLGNDKSTPDSLGPNTVENVLVTRYLSFFSPLEEGYSNVSKFIPNVMGNTGIETSDMMKSVVDVISANKIIVVDALKTNHFERLGKTIQITDRGILPGSGIGNMRKAFSKNEFGRDVIAIGVPTVISIDNGGGEYMVTPTNIDFMIEKLSMLLGEGINISLHKNFLRQNTIE